MDFRTIIGIIGFLGKQIDKYMNRAKSIFISLANMVWGYFTYIFVRDLISGGFTLTGLGLFFVSLLPLAFFMVLLMFRPVARTSKSLNVFTALISVGIIIIFTEVYQTNTTSNYLLMATGSLVMWLLYVYWYSFLPKSRLELSVGGLMPDLIFKNQDNEEFHASDFVGKKVLYLFYRGNWCPLCMAQIKEISAQYRELEKRGVEVLLISPQRASKSIALAKKMEVNFHFLTDTNNAMARKLKIDHKHSVPLGMEVLGYKSESVLPTVIITDEQGKILFLDQTDNYRVRPEPETFLKAIDG